MPTGLGQPARPASVLPLRLQHPLEEAGRLIPAVGEEPGRGGGVVGLDRGRPPAPAGIEQAVGPTAVPSRRSMVVNVGRAGGRRLAWQIVISVSATF